MDYRKQGRKLIDMLRDIDKDDILGKVGLQERDSAWGTALSTIGIFALGAIVGAGLGLVFAPKSGVEFRNEIGEKVRRKASELPIGEENTSSYPNSSRSQVPIT